MSYRRSPSPGRRDYHNDRYNRGFNGRRNDYRGGGGYNGGGGYSGGGGYGGGGGYRKNFHNRRSYGGGGGGGYNRYDKNAPWREYTTSIFVGNLPFTFTARDLKEVFDKCGEIENITINTNRNSQSRGSGFITFRTREAAQEAFDRFNQYSLEGRPLRIDWDEGKNSKDKRRRNTRVMYHKRRSYRSRSPPYRRRSPGRSPGRYERRGRSRSRSPNGFSPRNENNNNNNNNNNNSQDRGYSRSPNSPRSFSPAPRDGSPKHNSPPFSPQDSPKQQNSPLIKNDEVPPKPSSPQDDKFED
eukprot:TRINITY_DN891_c3_g1_i1.p1 TRINITY_DN891_c3_g1~~TRINITY_DN891_c3_g1_i1.p1  ORF type:complete len:299 (+),score=130.92 TRINITY_DN891_c3_g1_i1:230-1126(+)